jgi:CO/xanthine dehydrogenase Mo-binding subunit
MLRLQEAQVRVIAPHVGGGFGPKGRFYQEDYLIPYAARALGRPVKWIEDRREHALTTTQEREQMHEVAVALRRDGTILAIRDRFVQDMGAYVSAGVVVPFNTLSLLPGPYRVAALEVEATCVYTNRVTVSPVRGAGQPEAAFVMEHIIDHAAAALRLDPADVRRRNLIARDAFPYSGGLRDMDGQPIVYDSGDYPACLERALEELCYAAARADQVRLRGLGVYRGIGLACYIELTGVGPQEEAIARVEGGRLHVIVGCGAQGQGHQTILAQLSAAELGIDPDDVTVTEGDTHTAGVSMGTYGSRTAVVAGSAVIEAVRALRAKLLAERPDLAEGDGPEVRRARVVALARLGRVETRGTFAPAAPTVSSGVHAAVVEVTPETGEVRILRYVIVHDCGRMINPTLVEGQIFGGFVHGLGETLYERLIYDGDGQLLTTTLMDYLLPTAAEVPEVTLEHIEVPSPLNTLGAKGAGEGGVIPVAAALSLAVQDALRPFGVAVDRVPLTPEASWRRAERAVHQPEGSGDG